MKLQSTMAERLIVRLIPILLQFYFYGPFTPFLFQLIPQLKKSF
jgi:hypothetical protein